MTSIEEWDVPEGGGRLQPFASFRYRNFRWLWAAGVSYGWVRSSYFFAFAWLALETLDAGVSFLGAVALVAGLPLLLLVLPAGVLADRMDRRFLLAASHILIALALVLAAILSGAASVSKGLVLVAAFIPGIGLALGDPVRAALIPSIVPRRRLLNANALEVFSQGAGAVVGPGVTGVAIALWDVEGAFVVLAVVMLVGTLFLIPLRVPPHNAPSSTPEEPDPPRRLTPAGMFADIGAGLRFVTSGAPEMRVLFVLLVTATLLGPWLVLDVGVFVDNLDVSATDASWLFAVIGAGGLITELILASITRLSNGGGWYLGMLIAGAIVTLLIWFSGSYSMVAALCVVYGLAVAGRGILFRTLVQVRTPLFLMGRTMAIYFTVLAVGVVLSGVVTAAGASALRGDAGTIAAVAAMVVVCGYVMVRNPELRRMSTYPEPAELADEPSTAAPGAG